MGAEDVTNISDILSADAEVIQLGWHKDRWNQS